jgi:hypothetical protein
VPRSINKTGCVFSPLHILYILCVITELEVVATLGHSHLRSSLAWSPAGAVTLTLGTR